MDILKIDSKSGLYDIELCIQDDKHNQKACLLVIDGYCVNLAERNRMDARFAEGVVAAAYLKIRCINSSLKYKFRWDMLIDDIHNAVADLRDTFDDIPCFIMGVGIGTFMAVSFSSRYQSGADGYVLVNPYEPKRIAGLYAIAIRRAAKKNNRMATEKYMQRAGINLMTDISAQDPMPMDEYSALCNGAVELLNSRQIKHMADKPYYIAAIKTDKSAEHIAKRLVGKGKNVILRWYENDISEANENYIKDISDFIAMNSWWRAL